MQDNRFLLIINPISGQIKKDKVPDLVHSRLSQSGFTVDIELTKCGGDATQLAQKAVNEGYYGVIACGGDGTINETAIALRETNTILGILPCGSGNGLARHLEIPIDFELSLNIIQKNHVTRCDYGSVNNMPFFCTFGVGFDATVSHRFAQQNRRGKMMYIKSAITEYLNYNQETYTLKANGETITEEAFIVACCNASQYGNNAYIAPHASMTDGLIDVTVIHRGSLFDSAIMGFDLFSGYLDRNTHIRTFRTNHLEINRNKDGAAHIDGEALILGKELSVNCHPQGLNIFTPENNHQFRPLVTPFNSMMQDIKIAFSHIFSH